MSTENQFVTEELTETNQTFSEFIRFFRDLIIILIIVICIRIFFVTPFQINGSSMETNYHDGEYIMVDKFSYLNFPATFGIDSTNKGSVTSFISGLIGKIPLRVGDPSRGDVVVITPHVDASREYYIKRVIALPGDIIKFSSGNVLIKKSGASGFIQLNETYLSANNKGQTYLPEYVEGDQFTVPENAYWVMGDNRNNSADSRSCFRNCFGSPTDAHFIKRRDVVGTILLDFGYFKIFGDGGLLSSGKLTWTHPPRFLDHPKKAEYPELN